MRKVFLNELPRKICNNKTYVDWKKTIGYIVDFEYDGFIGKLKIKDILGQKITIEYDDNDCSLQLYHFKNGCLASILGKKTKDFKYEIGCTLVDKKRNITIVNKKIDHVIKDDAGHYIDRKLYNYMCNVCGYKDGWIIEASIIAGNGCSCCSGHTVVEGINDIPTTAPWMIKYFQGGYDEAKLYTHGSEKKIYPLCPSCGTISTKLIKINDIYRTKSFLCSCLDGISYPEKLISNVLKQLCISYKFQPSTKTFNWIKGCTRYDFFIDKNNVIIETHGIQHYKQCGFTKRTLKQEQENDNFKETLAKANNIKHYIALDCRKSELEWIKKSVMESELPTLFNFNETDIDWLKCHEHALTNLVKEVCDYKKSHKTMTYSDIGNIYNLEKSTIGKYINKGKILGWC